jgi:hypothetical protein
VAIAALKASSGASIGALVGSAVWHLPQRLGASFSNGKRLRCLHDVHETMTPFESSCSAMAP